MLTFAQPKPVRNRIRSTSEMSEMVLAFAEAIDNIVPNGEPIVILGRDLWSVVPILRCVYKRTVQYFMWSRLQGSCYEERNHWGYLAPSSLALTQDKSTAEQWIKEVYPQSWIFDTGYQGSIFNAIRLTDRKQSLRRMMLGSSSGSYKQLELPFNHLNIVEMIEHFRKLSHRSKGYSQSGQTIYQREDEEDTDSGAPTMKIRRKIIRDNYRMMRQCGLTRSEAKKYATFTGATPKERLGLGAKERQIHYRSVSFARSSY